MDLATNRDSQRGLVHGIPLPMGKTISLYLKNIRLTDNKYRLAGNVISETCIRGVSLLDSPVYGRSHSLPSAENVTYLFRGNYLDTPEWPSACNFGGNPLCGWNKKIT
jgi:hypothetical protein